MAIIGGSKKRKLSTKKRKFYGNRREIINFVEMGEYAIRIIGLEGMDAPVQFSSNPENDLPGNINNNLTNKTYAFGHLRCPLIQFFLNLSLVVNA